LKHVPENGIGSRSTKKYWGQVVLNRYEKLSRNAFGHFMCEKRGEDDRKTRKVRKNKKEIRNIK
jgi:hypothetical protein